jgi:hypothetical protein
MSQEHRHALDDLSMENFCSCGVEICSSISPDGGLGCNLENGHRGPCMNTFVPERGTWEKKSDALSDNDKH